MAGFRRSIYVQKNPDNRGLEPLYTTAAESFHRNLPGYTRTPLISLPDIAKQLQVKAVFIKDESCRFNLPSFKVLGASWGTHCALATTLGLPLDVSVEKLATEARRNSLKLFTATDGNHGRAVAFMARLLGIPAVVHVPFSLDERAKTAIADEGATVTVTPGDYDEVVQVAAQAASTSHGGVLIQDTSFPSYEDIPARIVEGYTTILTEIDGQLAELGLLDKTNITVITPVGVGSFAHAVLRHNKSRLRSHPAKVVAVEPDTAACLYKSLRADARTKIRTSETIMTGMNCGTVSNTAWPDFRTHLDASITVSDFEAHCAVQELKSYGVSSGPCGAATLAALRYLASSLQRQTVELDANSTVLLLNTEAERPYKIPHNVSTDDEVELTQILTRIESTNPTLSIAEGTGEGAIANFIEAWLEHRGFDSHRYEAVPGRPSIVGVVPGSDGDGRDLMINGHTDTVSLKAYMGDPLGGQLTQKNGRDVISGRGCLDMKAGLAAGMAALVFAATSATTPGQSKLRGSVILAAVADEEDISKGTEEILAVGWRAHGAVITEPTSLRLCTSHKGFVWIEIEILGNAAHGSMPELGVDAILHAGLFLSALQMYATTELPKDPLLGQASLHCGLIEGGQELSSYPSSCKVQIEFRTIPTQTVDGIVRDMCRLLERMADQDESFEYRNPKVLAHRPSFKLHSQDEFGLTAGRAANQALSKPINPEAMSFWCDAALLDEAGIPTVVFGPSGEGLHAKEEWVQVDSIRQTAEMLRYLISDFCA